VQQGRAGAVAAEGRLVREDNAEAFSPLLQRIAAASGLVFVLMVVLSIIVNPEATPDTDAAATEFLEYVRDEKDNIELSALFGALGAVALLWFTGTVTAALSRAETLVHGFARFSWVTLAGGLIAVALILVNSALLLTISATPEDAVPAVARALVVASQICFVMAAVGFVAMFSSAGLLVLRCGGLPRWLGWHGLLTGFLWTLALFAVLAPEDNGGAFEVYWPLALIGFLVWVVAASVALVRDVGRPSTTPSPPAAP
jgi:hypothetical protein